MHYWQVLARLERLRDLLVDRRNLIVNLSAEEKGLNAVQKHLETYIQSMPLRSGESLRPHTLVA